MQHNIPEHKQGIPRGYALPIDACILFSLAIDFKKILKKILFVAFVKCFVTVFKRLKLNFLCAFNAEIAHISEVAGIKKIDKRAEIFYAVRHQRVI